MLTQIKTLIIIQILLLSSMATPQTADNLIFILDASGSMWGQVDGVNKIVIAKDVMADMINGLPENQNVGLVAYGHREKGDCDDVEELTPLSPLDKAALIGQIGKINPKGKTPITRSVRLTADKIKALNQETTIILVSDGKETCDPDPCEFVTEMKKNGISFTMHVIGFDVTEEEKAELECMAKAGGGNYYSADNANEFKIAAADVMEKPKFTGGYLQITALKQSQPFLARVYVPNPSAEGYTAVANTSTDPKYPKRIELQPGIYDIRVRDENVPGTPEQWIKGVEIKAGEVTEHTVEFAQSGVLEIITTKDGEQFSAYVTVHNPGEKLYLAYEHSRKTYPARFDLLPGTYEVNAQNNNVPEKPVITVSDIEVTAGDTVRKAIEFVGEGFLEITALKGRQMFSTYVTAHKAGEKNYLAYAHSRNNAPATFKLLPGLYDVKVQNLKVPAKPVILLKNVEVKAGETTRETVEFVEEGVLEISAQKAGQSITTYVAVHKAGDKSYLTYSHTRPAKNAEFKLLPGFYDVKIQDQVVPEKPLVTFESVEVTSGQKTTRTAQFVQEGMLEVAGKRGGEVLPLYVTVHKSGEKGYLTYGHSRINKPVTIKLLPGAYDVYVTYQKEKLKEKKMGIVIESGKTESLTFVF